jgi:vacuolar-type H+-ATPase subunit F/Vma7
LLKKAELTQKNFINKYNKTISNYCQIIIFSHKSLNKIQKTMKQLQKNWVIILVISEISENDLKLKFMRRHNNKTTAKLLLKIIVI